MPLFFERKLLRELRKWAGKKKIVVVTGMRQVGKTTLFKMLFEEIESKNKVFLDLENPVVQKAFRETDYDNIWVNLKAYGVSPDAGKAFVFLDEVQALPEAVNAVKYLFDHYDVQFFITGSSSFYLKNLFSESLAGRKVLFELRPLDFEEFLWFKSVRKDFGESFAEKAGAGGTEGAGGASGAGKSVVSFEKTIKFFEEFLFYGGFPGVVIADSIEEKKAVLEDVFKSYFNKDVKSLANFKDNHKLQDFVLLLLQRAGSKLNVSRLASELGVSRETLYAYLSFLEATYFVTFVSPFSRSVDREVSGAKKVYACDTGLLNQFAQVSSGALLENAVFNVLQRAYGSGGIRFYQRRSGVEIDFVLPEQGTALEVKETGTEFDLVRLRKLVAALKLREGYVVSKAFVQGGGFICVTDL